MKLAQVDPRRSVQKSARQVMKAALRDGVSGLVGNDPRSRAAIEKVCQIIAADGRFWAELLGEPEGNRRFLQVQPAGTERLPLLRFYDGYTDLAA